jgi:hypothetical protein
MIAAKCVGPFDLKIASAKTAVAAMLIRTQTKPEVRDGGI